MSTGRSLVVDSISLGVYFAACWLVRVLGYDTSFPQISETYALAGIKWDPAAGSRLSTLLFLAFIMMATLQVADRWRISSRFHGHDAHSFVHAVARVVGYGVLTAIGVGLYGLKLRPDTMMDPIQFSLDAAVALIAASWFVLVCDALEAAAALLLKAREQ